MISLEKILGPKAWVKKRQTTEDKGNLTASAAITRERFRKKAFFFISIPLAFAIVLGSVDTVGAARTSRSKKGAMQYTNGRLLYDVRPALSPLPWRDPFRTDSSAGESALKKAAKGDVPQTQFVSERKLGRSRHHRYYSPDEGVANVDGYGPSRHRRRYSRQDENRDAEAKATAERALTPQVLGCINGEAGSVVLIRVDKDTVALREGQRYRDLAVLSLGISTVKLSYKGKIYELAM